MQRKLAGMLNLDPNVRLEVLDEAHYSDMESVGDAVIGRNKNILG